MNRPKSRRLAPRTGFGLWATPRQRKQLTVLSQLRTPVDVSRRSFLRATAAALFAGGALNLFIPQSAEAQPSAGVPSRGVPSNYLGNPNAYWSSIDASGGIVTSRDDETERGVITLYTPGMIHVSARAIAGVGEIRNTDGSVASKLFGVPYSDLEFGWDFGDPTGTETFTNVGGGRANTKGATVNANDRQWGGEAAYCYRNAAPGGITYTITLTIRAKFSNSSFITTRVTKQVRVKPFTEHPKYVKTIYMDPDNGNDSLTGLAPEFVRGKTGPIKTTAGLIGKYIEGTRVAIKRGTAPTDVGLLNLGNSSVSISFCRWTTYSMSGRSPIFPGIGTKPKFNTNPCFVSIRNFAPPTGKDSGKIQDVVFGDFDLEIVGTAGEHLAVFALDRTDLGEYRNIYWDNIAGISQNGYKSGVWIYSPTHSRLGIWNCSFDNDLAVSTPPMGGPIAYTARYWYFQMGGSRSGSLANDNMSHLNYTSTQENYLDRWLTYLGGANGAYAVNGNCDPPEGSPAPGWGYAKYHVISECRISGAGFAGFDFGADRNVFFREVCIERCDVHHIGNPVGTGNWLVWAKSVIEITFRDNELWELNGSPYVLVGTDASPLNVVPRIPPYTTDTDPPAPIYKAYGNKCHRKANSAPSASWLWMPGDACQFTDNEFMDERATAQGILGFWNFRNPFIYGALIDRNRYYTPNYAQRRFYRGTTDDIQTLATFNVQTRNAFDQNPPSTGGTTTSKPNWVDPANGDFTATT